MREHNETKETARRDILVLGAGYAGMSAAVNLGARVKRRDDVRVTVINADERFVERLRLHQVATGQRLAEFDIPELLDGIGVGFVRGRVAAIDPDAKTVRLDDQRLLRYDSLVYALGGLADTGRVPGADEHAFTLDGAADAAALAARLDRLEAGTVVVGGAGLTGIEAAAEIAEQYPRLRVMLLGRDEPGAAMADKPRAYLRATLDRLGVEVRSDAEVVKVLADSVELADGESIAADAVLLTSGVRANPVAAAAGCAVDERGRIVTDATLRSISHPDIYAVGDAAAIEQGYGLMHGTCQSGMPTGVHAAVCLARELKGKQPKAFRFGYYHTPVSLGRNDAVVQFTKPDSTPRRWYLTGKRATWYKETVSSSPWPTFQRMTKFPRSGAIWPSGGRYTRRAGAR
ncbi:NAD(P)/FAD-dependent oxidoreductase [Nocardia cyriacigeorgica]|uniref:NAD(P)/FAD-dependent oxidoreductase n=1 Tax=Nocardia cyriacigeorgica TaxID=135487 RepID=UPI001892D73B|nr:FAD-dependent oxidoreductase [Nocardia cyriacigeorgica]MBF6440322.1 FAD-dependent oxidoreductase [Nocardia cyriacigeorgica]MBF6457128.1 FAD-dependent oxidoreductase [Nocardia cyriacigeorgica]MBF6480906.1 FAD-dependent oxidoreductase [Nocardia cyriacigeorgica]MBF6554211.1 FAD-dependent oxidoreductase [Nocardia cyriacigeorgica]